MTGYDNNCNNDNTASDEIEPETLQATINAINDIPIIARLQFAANLLFDRCGGDRHSEGANWNSVIATEVVYSVIRDLEKHPQAANLRSPQP